MINKDKIIKNWIIWIGNKIGDEGARMISDSLKINTTLTVLDLGGDEIEANENKKNRNIKKYGIQKRKKEKYI